MSLLGPNATSVVVSDRDSGSNISTVFETVSIALFVDGPLLTREFVTLLWILADESPSIRCLKSVSVFEEDTDRGRVAITRRDDTRRCSKEHFVALEGMSCVLRVLLPLKLLISFNA